MLAKTPIFDSGVCFDADIDRIYAHDHADLNNILHIFDANWHGIRGACGNLPGHKLTITHTTSLRSEEIRYIFGLIWNYSIKICIFHGYSKSASQLAYLLWREFGKNIDIRVVTHVSTSQFEHLFELEMLNIIREQLSIGILKRLGSVKPDFYFVVDFCWNETILNFSPNLCNVSMSTHTTDQAEVFVPLENTFRKNLYVNVIAAMRSDYVSKVICVNEPTFLDNIMVVTKLRRIPFQTRHSMLELMSRVDLVMNVTFAECQPMTQLEALAMGTPCLTGPLRIPEVQDHELAKLCTVETCDNPRIVSESVDQILAISRSEPERLTGMLENFRNELNRLAMQSYLNFIFK